MELNTVNPVCITFECGSLEAPQAPPIISFTTLSTCNGGLSSLVTLPELQWSSGWHQQNPQDQCGTTFHLIKPGIIYVYTVYILLGSKFIIILNNYVK